MPRKAAIIKKLLKQSGVDLDAINSMTGQPSSTAQVVGGTSTVGDSVSLEVPEPEVALRDELGYAPYLMVMGA